MTKNKKITKEVNIAELIAEFPEAANILWEYGLHCVGCAAAAYDSLEEGAKLHGLEDKEIEKMVAEINGMIE